VSDEQINIDIRANDTAGDKLDEVAGKVDKLEKASPVVDVDADTAAALDDLGDVDDAARKLDGRQTEVDVTADTGKADAELKDLADQADTLDKSDPTVDVTADTGTADADLKATLDAAQALAAADARIVVEAQIAAAQANLRELKADLNALTGGPAGAAGGPMRAAQVEVDGYTAATGKANDTTRGFIGNAVGELPGLAGAFGPATEAVGQLTEGALAGEASIKQLALAGGAIAGISLAIQAINDRQEAIAKTRAWRTEQVDGYVDAIRRGVDAADDLAVRLSETGKIELDLGALVGLDSVQVKDVTSSLAAAGVSIQQFTEAATTGAPGLDKLREALVAANVPTKEAGEVYAAAVQQADLFSKAQERAEVVTRVFGTTAEETARQAALLDSETRTAKTALDILAGGAEGAQRKLDDATDAADRLRTKLSDRSAYLDVRDAFDELGDKAVEAWTAAEEGADDAERKARDHERALADVKQAAADYLTEVLKLPARQVTDIVAQIDEGNYQQTLQQLADLEKARTTNLFVRTILTGGVGGAVNGSGNGPLVDSFGGREAFGGPVVESAGTTTIIMPTGVIGLDVLRATGAERQRSGSLYGGR
jgi:hypothetical protein